MKFHTSIFILLPVQIIQLLFKLDVVNRSFTILLVFSTSVFTERSDGSDFLFILQMCFTGALTVASNFIPVILYLIEAVQLRTGDWILLVSVLQEDIDKTSREHKGNR